MKKIWRSVFTGFIQFRLTLCSLYIILPRFNVTLYITPCSIYVIFPHVSFVPLHPISMLPNFTKCLFYLNIYFTPYQFCPIYPHVNSHHSSLFPFHPITAMPITLQSPTNALVLSLFIFSFNLNFHHYSIQPEKYFQVFLLQKLFPPAVASIQIKFVSGMAIREWAEESQKNRLGNWKTFYHENVFLSSSLNFV